MLHRDISILPALVPGAVSLFKLLSWRLIRMMKLPLAAGVVLKNSGEWNHLFGVVVCENNHSFRRGSRRNAGRAFRRVVKECRIWPVPCGTRWACGIVREESAVGGAAQ